MTVTEIADPVISPERLTQLRDSTTHLVFVYSDNDESRQPFAVPDIADNNEIGILVTLKFGDGVIWKPS